MGFLTARIVRPVGCIGRRAAPTGAKARPSLHFGVLHFMMHRDNRGAALVAIVVLRKVCPECGA